MRAVQSRAPLTRERILDAALAVVDRDGLEGLSMRRLGAELGVEAMALYRYIPNKDALLEAVLERVLSELPAEFPTTGTWQGDIRGMFRIFLGVMRRHPRTIPLLSTMILTDPAVARPAALVLAVLEGAGFDDLGALQALTTVTSAVVGFALSEAGTAEACAGLRERIATGEPLEDLAGLDPVVAALIPQLANLDPDTTFEYGIDVILAGLEAKLALSGGRGSAP
ncbi:MAG TPA: TetR/AcrR family transcriptional regulator C-terminal domain-containing protein [Candidatus Saccharimonadales bacterium]|nr:TetR/AcrR family transcriptional regulator C-terminal domain-containing protein [Candidatus Saccharimonadales bacterium]